MPIDPVLGSIAVGLGALGGSSHTNRMNAKMAREQMRFQERMSSTAAQRAVKDYEAAGLNPALAYDRPASSPGGTSAVMQDSLGQGISSGLSARTTLAQLEQIKEGTEKLRNERKLAEVNARVAANTEEETTKTAIDRLKNDRAMMQPTKDLLDSQNALLRYELYGAKNQAELEKKMGIYSNILRFIRPR